MYIKNKTAFRNVKESNILIVDAIIRQQLAYMTAILLIIRVSSYEWSISTFYEIVITSRAT